MIFGNILVGVKRKIMGTPAFDYQIWTYEYFAIFMKSNCTTYLFDFDMDLFYSRTPVTAHYHYNWITFVKSLKSLCAFLNFINY